MKVIQRVKQHMARLLNKKAESGTGISLETIGKLVLVVIVLIVLWTFIAKLMGTFSSDKEKATLRNFETLAGVIKNMENGEMITDYPIYIENNFVVLGYWTASNAIGGICPLLEVTEYTYNVKPTQCGIENTGCLCLCQYDKDFGEICHREEGVILCKTAGDFGKDISFEGDMKNCDFSLIKGNNEPQTINITKNRNIVVISS